MAKEVTNNSGLAGTFLLLTITLQQSHPQHHFTSPVVDTTSTNPGLYLHGKDHAIILHLSRMRGFPGRSDSSFDHARRIVPGGNSMSTLQSNRIRPAFARRFATSITDKTEK